MGTWSGHKAKFVRRFADVRSERERGVKSYIAAVHSSEFPSLEESYEMDPQEFEKLLESEGHKGWAPS